MNNYFGLDPAGSWVLPSDSGLFIGTGSLSVIIRDCFIAGTKGWAVDGYRASDITLANLQVGVDINGNSSPELWPGAGVRFVLSQDVKIGDVASSANVIHSSQFVGTDSTVLLCH